MIYDDLATPNWGLHADLAEERRRNLALTAELHRTRRQCDTAHQAIGELEHENQRLRSELAIAHHPAGSRRA